MIGDNLVLNFLRIKKGVSHYLQNVDKNVFIQINYLEDVNKEPEKSTRKGNYVVGLT
jgi:hypothetical protein